jgi:hypothetical protein
MRDEWYVARRGQDGNKRYGPVPLSQLRQLIDDGKVRGEDLIWREGMAQWQRADRCDDLFPPPGRGTRDYPPDDRRGYAYGPGRGPRYGPEEDDDRPYRRRYPPPRSSSNGPIIGLVVGGGVLAILVLGCGGLTFFGYLINRNVAAYKTASYGGSKGGLAPDGDEAATARDEETMANPGPDGAPLALGQSIPYGLSELYYTDKVAPMEGQAVGNYLSNAGHFPDDHGATVQVDKDAASGTYRVRFCLRDGAAWDPDTFDNFRGVREEIEANALPGKAVEVDLCDGSMNTVRTIRAGD